MLNGHQRGCEAANNYGVKVQTLSPAPEKKDENHSNMKAPFGLAVSENNKDQSTMTAPLGHTVTEM